ncbi:MAG: MerR family transcriptional regulator [Nitrospirota bacterium]|nr:MerR family transcriptional regulator [Nitrospirota bacterium]
METELKLGEKTFYKIGEVSAITKLPASVLRFWESEFSFLRPRKSQGRHRVYDQQTIETVLEIKRMLYEEGYTIMGLKRFWRRRRVKTASDDVQADRFERVRNELQEILGIIDAHNEKSGQLEHSN